MCSIAASLCLAGIQVVTDSPELSVIAGAAAQIAGQECPDLIISGIRILPQQGNGIHNEAGIAEAALVSCKYSSAAWHNSYNTAFRFLRKSNPPIQITPLLHNFTQHYLSLYLHNFLHLIHITFFLWNHTKLYKRM